MEDATLFEFPMVTTESMIRRVSSISHPLHNLLMLSRKGWINDILQEAWFERIFDDAQGVIRVMKKRHENQTFS
jgi:hypothetical protein